MTHKNPISEASCAVAITSGRMESEAFLARMNPTAKNKRLAKEAKQAHKMAVFRLEAIIAGAAYALEQVAIAPYKAEIVASDIELYGSLSGVGVAA